MYSDIKIREIKNDRVLVGHTETAYIPALERKEGEKLYLNLRNVR